MGSCIFVKQSDLSFTDFILRFLNFCFTDFCSDLYDFIPSADLSFDCSLFLILFGESLNVDLSFFFLFEEGLYSYKLPSKNGFCSIPWFLNGFVFITVCLTVFFLIY